MSQEKLNSLFEYLLTVVKSTEQFVLAQAPDLVKEIINFNLVVSAVLFAVATIFFVVFLTVAYRCTKAAVKETDYSAFEGYTFAIVMSLVISLISGVVMYGKLYIIINIITAPKLYLLKYLADLLKG